MHSHVHDHETWLCSHTSPNHSCHSILSPCSLPMRSHAFLASNRIVQLNLNTQAGTGMCFLACTCSQAHNPKFTTKNIHTVFFFLVHLCTQFQHLFFESQARSLLPGLWISYFPNQSHNPSDLVGFAQADTIPWNHQVCVHTTSWCTLCQRESCPRHAPLHHTATVRVHRNACFYFYFT